MRIITFSNINILSVLKNPKYNPITIYITGPFVLHDLLITKYKLSDIKQLKLNYKYNFDDSTFIYIDDIIPEKSNYTDENTYAGYNADLQFMNIIPHNRLNSIKK